MRLQDVLYGAVYPSTDLRRVLPVATDWAVDDASYFPTEFTASSVLAEPLWADGRETAGIRCCG